MADQFDVVVVGAGTAGMPATIEAIGEAIGGATLSGNCFVGGMSVTPALSFGRWLGRELAEQARHARQIAA